MPCVDMQRRIGQAIFRGTKMTRAWLRASTAMPRLANRAPRADDFVFRFHDVSGSK